MPSMDGWWDEWRDGLRGSFTRGEGGWAKGPTEHEQIMQSHAIVWTPCLMHRCVISTMFGSCFSLKKRLISFLFFIFMCFLFLLLFCIIKIKCFFFTFVFLFIWMQVWSLEKEDTPHSSSRVFLHYYKFYFFLFSTLYLVYSFL